MNYGNIYKSPITTAIGALIILASIASVFVPDLEMDWTKASIGIAAGAAFMFAPDKKASKRNG